MRGYPRFPSATRLFCHMGTGRSSISHPLWNSQRLLGGSQQRQFHAPSKPAPRIKLKRPPRVKVKKGSQASTSQGPTEDDVPPLEFWQRSVLRESLTPEECHRAASTYCELADPDRSTWKGELERDHDISRNTLHTMAIILVSGPPSPLWRLGLHMLGTASDLGFAPSTLLLIRLMRQSEDSAKLTKSPLFTSAMARFRDIVRQKQDPDALTLQGLILADRDDNAKALDCFDQAVQAGSRTSDLAVPEEASLGADQEPAADAEHSSSELNVRPFRWSWEASCHIGRAKILLQRGRRKEAVNALRIAAMELDNPQGYVELAKLLPEDAPERDRYLRLAAVSGHTEACQLLGESEVEMATRPGQSKGDAREHSLWASEWFSLAGDSEKAAGARWASATSPGR